MPTQTELVVAARSGDRQAFSTLMLQEAPGALRLATAILHTPAEAEDAIQDACIRAWLDLPKLRSVDRWSAWFRRVTVHAALDHARRPYRVREIGITNQDTPDPVDSIVILAERDRIRRAIAGLSSADRAILVLRFAEDLELQAVADAMGLRVGTAKSRLHRILQRLRLSLEVGP